jgi:GNAT superfamily N-acetyltransferase
MEVKLPALRRGDRDALLAVGGARYLVVRPGTVEMAFAVVDAYQEQGLGASLMRHLAAIAQPAGLRELTAEVLPENVPLLKVLREKHASSDGAASDRRRARGAPTELKSILPGTVARLSWL